MSKDESFMIVVMCASSIVMSLWCVLMVYYWRTNRRRLPHPAPIITTDTVVRVYVDSSSNQPETQCYICADLCANVRLQPCNHGGVCYTCVVRIPDSRCPLCRVHFTGLWLSHITE